MKYFIFSVVTVLILNSCGTSEKQENQTSKNLTEFDESGSKSLLDSANKMIGEFGVSPEATALVKESIEMNPQNKRAHQKLISIHAVEKDHAKLKDALEEMSQNFPNDPYSNLHLAMEKELQADTGSAPFDLYSKSFQSFIAVLDTLPAQPVIMRKGYILNAALSARLADMDKNTALEESKTQLNEDELILFGEIFDQLANSDRSELLNVRRN